MILIILPRLKLRKHSRNARRTQLNPATTSIQTYMSQIKPILAMILKRACQKIETLKMIPIQNRLLAKEVKTLARSKTITILLIRSKRQVV
jgi:hypothetical protein